MRTIGETWKRSNGTNRFRKNDFLAHLGINERRHEINKLCHSRRVRHNDVNCCVGRSCSMEPRDTLEFRLRRRSAGPYRLGPYDGRTTSPGK
jgi:hypothetical protein